MCKYTISAGLRLTLPQGIFQVWPELVIKVNKKHDQ